ncbi:zinc finger BED domain-containing protein RICESLEEPER 2-like isoform X1 [Papaver somniferum]|uniref:zinc finger BED domain-containing protein RICESLEEPER 2-like isoform X1 n=1 Tax=Papaver somniferum TaxID=3469 RepID=UPI000E6FBFDE|nr:zinc finger BED domain-containing protein RICESLEEPER 2-like isoform X1 [Papaver somniferum]
MDVSDLVETTPTSNVTDSQLPSPATGGTKKRKLTSIVWKGFEQIEEVDPDDPQKIKRLKLAQCKICDRKFSGDPKAGTSHLKRHMDSCLKKNQSADETQTLIAPIGSGTFTAFRFCQARARKNIIKLIILRELPFQFVEDPFFQWFINDSFHPRFVKFSRATVRRDSLNFFEMEKQVLKRTLLEAPGKIYLTSDLWLSCQKLSYMSITAHFLDKNWVLHKRIIFFTLVDKSHTGEHISELLIQKLSNDWGISMKIFSLSLDNASANTVSVQRIKVMLPDLPSKGDLFHSVLQKQEETISDDEDDSFWQSRSQNRRDPLSSASEELTRYFAYPEPATFEDMKNFDILGWWKANEKRYPVLSCIARDVLAVPVSTVASESAFSLGKRVLSDYRSSLTPQMLECCVFLKDWWKAELKNRMMTLDPLNDDITPVDDENDVSESSCVSLR